MYTAPGIAGSRWAAALLSALTDQAEHCRRLEALSQCQTALVEAARRTRDEALFRRAL
mgnify:CR=1 FL=1